MKRKLVFASIALVALVLLGVPLIASAASRAGSAADGSAAALPLQPQGVGYAITWWTVGGGGGTSTNGGYDLTGTVGQSDTGAQANGTYTLVGGYWGGAPSPLENLLDLFLPFIRK